MVSWNNHSLEFPATAWKKPGWQHQVSCPILTTLFNSGHCTVSVLQGGGAHVSEEGTTQSFVLVWGREMMPVREEGVKCKKRCQEGQHLRLSRTRHTSVLLNYIWCCGGKWFEGLTLYVPGAVIAESFRVPTLLSGFSQDALNERKLTFHEVSSKDSRREEGSATD